MTTQIGLTPSDPYVTPSGGTFTGTPGSGVFEITLTTSSATAASPIVSGTTTINAETYNGAIPGPTLRLNVGDTAIVRLINNLPHPTGIHWHGIELGNSADGTEVTQEGAVGAFPARRLRRPAGGTYLYKFKVPRPGIYLVPPPPPSFHQPCVQGAVRNDRRHRPGRGHARRWCVLPASPRTRSRSCSATSRCARPRRRTPTLTPRWPGRSG